MDVYPFLGSFRSEVMLSVCLLSVLKQASHCACGCELDCQSPPELGKAVSETSLLGSWPGAHLSMSTTDSV